MNKNDVINLHDYNYWARDLILNATARLTDEQYTAPLPLSFGSIRGTLVHTLSAEMVWRRRCQEGVSPQAMLAEAEVATFDALLQRWQEEEASMRAYLDSLSDAALGERIHYTNTKGVSAAVGLQHILAHVVNHGTQHRSETAIFLTEFGQSPGNIDLIFYAIERGL